MNLYDIARTVSDCVATLGEVLYPDLICSITVNGIVLAVLLLGAIRLMGPLCPKGLDENLQN